MIKAPATRAFRYDINGLRAWAVIAVVLYHFDVPGFGGGFVGVDVFFVISGFLMTSIVINRLTGNSGGGLLRYFYLARAIRILPALLVLVGALLMLGWFVLASPDYRILGGDAATSLTFLSNVKFWREAGYFDAASHEKWLLHTWSLSVEWQFYVLFPLLLWLVWRFFPGRRHAAYALTAGFGLSLVLSVVMTVRHPTAAFYLLPSRAWEMFAGGLVYVLVDKWAPNGRTRAVIELLGLGLIVVAVAGLDVRAAWPGYLALLPVCGTVLVLLAARQNSWYTNTRVAQALGLWSYSIYLWHWPVVVGLAYLELRGQVGPVLVGVWVTFVLGWASYRWVENPARSGLTVLPQWPAIGAMGLAVLALVLPSVYARQMHGVPGRLSPAIEVAAQEALNFNQRRTKCHVMTGEIFQECVYGGPEIKVILMGDSHASAVVTALQAALPSPQDGVLAYSYTSCPTLFGVQRERKDIKCAEFNEWVMRQISTRPAHIPLVVVNRTTGAAFGSQHPTDPTFNTPSVYFSRTYAQPTPEFLAEFRENLVASACRIAQNRPVYLVRPFPEMPIDVPRTVARRLLLGKEVDVSISLAVYHQRHDLVWSAQDEAAYHCAVHILDPLPELCSDGRCKGSVDGRPLYYDDHHLSEFGNKLLVPMFRQVSYGGQTSVRPGDQHKP